MTWFPRRPELRSSGWSGSEQPIEPNEANPEPKEAPHE